MLKKTALFLQDGFPKGSLKHVYKNTWKESFTCFTQLNPDIFSGASRGFGRALAVELGNLSPSCSYFQSFRKFFTPSNNIDFEFYSDQ